MRKILKLQIKGEDIIEPLMLEGTRTFQPLGRFIQTLNEQDFDEVLIVDTVASFYKRDINFDILEANIKNLSCPLAYCGGVKTFSDFVRLFELGFDKIGLNSQNFEDEFSLARVAIKEFGRQAIFWKPELRCDENVSLYRFCGKEKATEWSTALSSLVASVGFGEVIVECLHTDAMLEGPSLDLLKFIQMQIYDRCYTQAVISSGVSSDIHVEILKNYNAITGFSVNPSVLLKWT